MALSYNLCLTSNIHFINYRKAFIIRCLSYYTKCDIRGSNAIFNTILHCHEKKNPAKCNYLSSRKMFLPTHTYKCTCRVCKNVYQRIIFFFLFQIKNRTQFVLLIEQLREFFLLIACSILKKPLYLILTLHVLSFNIYVQPLFP